MQLVQRAQLVFTPKTAAVCPAAPVPPVLLAQADSTAKTAMAGTLEVVLLALLATQTSTFP